MILFIISNGNHILFFFPEKIEMEQKFFNNAAFWADIASILTIV